MQKTPISSRKHVSLFGNVNAGKSSLFNAILGQDAAIVSPQPGTTTDPVVKAMELIPFGPIALVDTAGFEDISQVGKQRMKRTNDILNRTDLAIYVVDASAFDEDNHKKTVRLFKEKSMPYILVFTKWNMVLEIEKSQLKSKYKDSIFVDSSNENDVSLLKRKIAQELEKLQDEDETIVGNLLEENSTVILVVPIDSAAPKGRLILPQVQLIRDCLDHNIKCFVTKESELPEALKELKKIDLVVTDSQIFKLVSTIVPKEIPITSFSMLLARQKGDIGLLIEGAEKIHSLENNSKILMAEACTHNHTHEDIGRVKIPALMKKYTGKELNFDYCVGYDFPDNLEEYHMVVHCGGCMLNKKAVTNRLAICKDKNIPVTNYGVLLAHLNGILPRCSEIFNKA